MSRGPGNRVKSQAQCRLAAFAMSEATKNRAMQGKPSVCALSPSCQKTPAW